MSSHGPLLYRETRRAPRLLLLLMGAVAILVVASYVHELLDSSRSALGWMSVALTAVFALLLLLLVGSPEVTEVRPGALRARSGWLLGGTGFRTITPAVVDRVHATSYSTVDGGKGRGCRHAVHVHLAAGDKMSGFLVIPTRDPAGLCAAMKVAGFPIEEDAGPGAGQETSLRAGASSL